jgi:hypothetical protein
MVLPSREQTTGLFPARNARGLSSQTIAYSCAIRVALASLNSVRIGTELTIEPSRAYVRVIIDIEAPGPQASVAERTCAPA